MSASRCGSSICHGRREGAPPPVDLPVERGWASCSRLIADGLVSAVHDCSDGGAAVAMAEMALAGGTASP
jgi:phosphoribosylformylglycinamidine synthase